MMSLPHRHRSSVAALLAVSTASVAGAQTSAGTLAGTVALAGTDDHAPRGRPLRDVIVLLDDGGRTARSDSAGRFAFGALPAGTYRVLVRGLGFQPLEVTARVRGGDTTWLQFGLRPAAPQLATVTVQERGASGNAAFDERRASGRGKYYDQEYLQQSQGRQVSEILASAPGVRLVRQDDGSVSVASRRGRTSINAPGQCYMSIYVDGQRIYEPTVAEGSPSPLPSAQSSPGPVRPPSITAGARGGTTGMPTVNIDQLDLAQLGGIEVYAGPSTLPAELMGTGNACGAVLLWTRKR